jgi:uncharacterized protein
MPKIFGAIGFQWDEGNIDKNWIRHQVTHLECEQPFFNEPFLVHEDEAHSNTETRHYALGVTDRGRYLFIVFTMRDGLVRVISARDMNKRERRAYDGIK